MNSHTGTFDTIIHASLGLAAGVPISMDGRGRVVDNIFTERLWRSVKYEEVYLHDYGSPREAHQSLGRYFTFYNFDRPHQALDYRTLAGLHYQDCSMPSNLIRREGGVHLILTRFRVQRLLST